MKHFIKSPKILVYLLTIMGIVLHITNLNWGAPWYFHPDERNIANAVSQLHFPNQMNPHFFAYGSLPIYVIYFTGLFTHYFSPPTVRFEEAIVISRVYSALLATLLIPMLYILGKRLKDIRTGVLAAALATFSTGMIQYSHFGTFELWLTFFSVCLFWHCLNLLHRGKFKDYFLTAIIFGVLVAIKVTSVVFILLPLLAIVYRLKTVPKNRLISVGRGVMQILFLLIVAVCVYFLTNPYVILDQTGFTSSMKYESGVGLGTLPIFYTGGFFNTTPIVYQFLHVYPFLLNPVITLLFILCFFYLLFTTIKTKNSSFFILYASFFILFLSQVFLFVKWTRYLVPTLPFIYLIIALTFSNITKKKSFAITIIIICAVFSLSYFKTVFLSVDTRLAALNYAKQRIPQSAAILSEPYDLGAFPLQTVFPHMTTFNFYDLDSNSLDATDSNLQEKLTAADYIIVPSQRILQPRILNAQRFPKAHAYYENLLDGKLGFEKIYETPCDIFCQITYLGDPVYWWEQTVNVFDHPPVFIFKKI